MYEEFKESVHDSPVEFKAKTKSPIDVVVRRHDYAIGSTTGWHTHPGPVFITVTQGQLTYYLYDDPECTPHSVSAGQGFVDDGRGHMVRNESGQAAQDTSVIIAPGASLSGASSTRRPTAGSDSGGRRPTAWANREEERGRGTPPLGPAAHPALTGQGEPQRLALADDAPRKLRRNAPLDHEPVTRSAPESSTSNVITQTVGIRSDCRRSTGRRSPLALPGARPRPRHCRHPPRSGTACPVGRAGRGAHRRARSPPRGSCCRADQRDAGVDRVLAGVAAARERDEEDEDEPLHWRQHVELLVEDRGIDPAGPAPDHLPARADKRPQGARAPHRRARPARRGADWPIEVKLVRVLGGGSRSSSPTTPSSAAPGWSATTRGNIPVHAPAPLAPARR